MNFIVFLIKKIYEQTLFVEYLLVNKVSYCRNSIENSGKVFVLLPIFSMAQSYKKYYWNWNHE